MNKQRRKMTNKLLTGISNGNKNCGNSTLAFNYKIYNNNKNTVYYKQIIYANQFVHVVVQTLSKTINNNFLNVTCLQSL